MLKLKYIVEINSIGMNYQSPNGEIAALKDINLNISPGEFICIVGPSGCGKSTLLSIIAGLLKPSYGSITITPQFRENFSTVEKFSYIGGVSTRREIFAHHLKSIAKPATCRGRGHIRSLVINSNCINGTCSEVGYMLQKDYLFEWRTILQNVMLGLEIKNLINEESLEYVNELLKTYGLYEFRNKYPSQLSGGMRQRAALIRTLALKPDLLLLDEAFSALDYQTRLAVTDDIYLIIKQEKKTAIMVTHDIAESISMADRVVVLTKRPATIKNIHTISLTCDTKSPFKCREAPEFRYYFNTIWKELDVHV